jgi:flagellar capping protein FliD
MYRVDWTDDRLQERFGSIDRRFDDVNRRFDHVDSDIHWLRDEMNTRFDTLQRTMLQASVGVIVGLLGLIATQL